MKDLRMKLMEFLLKIQDETEYAVFIYFQGHVRKTISFDIAKSKKDFHNMVYRINRLDVEGIPQVIEDLKSFLPKEKRPVTTPVEEKIIYHTILPQKGEKLNEQQN